MSGKRAKWYRKVERELQENRIIQLKNDCRIICLEEKLKIQSMEMKRRTTLHQLKDKLFKRK